MPGPMTDGDMGRNPPPGGTGVISDGVIGRAEAGVLSWAVAGVCVASKDALGGFIPSPTRVERREKWAEPVPDEGGAIFCA